MPAPAEARAEQAADGGVALSGRLDLGSVARLAGLGPELFAGRDGVTVDLAAVSHADSGALALLVEWQRVATRAGCRLDFRNVPAPLRAIADVCGVDEVLALGPA